VRTVARRPRKSVTGDGLHQVRDSTVQAMRGGAFNTIAFNCHSGA